MAHGQIIAEYVAAGQDERQLAAGTAVGKGSNSPLERVFHPGQPRHELEQSPLRVILGHQLWGCLAREFHEVLHNWDKFVRMQQRRRLVNIVIPGTIFAGQLRVFTYMCFARYRQHKKDGLQNSLGVLVSAETSKIPAGRYRMGYCYWIECIECIELSGTFWVVE